MPEVRPFVGLVYDPAIAGPMEQVTAPPYDVITDEDQSRLYSASPHNIVRLDLGRDEPGDNASKDKYTRAADYLRSWVDQGVLVRTQGPRTYGYEIRFQLEGRERSVRGVIAEVDLDSGEGAAAIIPHERTLAGPIQDRLALLRSVQANLSPIYTVFAQASERFSTALSDATAGPPDREVGDESGAVHRLWIIERQSEEIAASIRDRALMIADGHHRHAVGLAYREEMRREVGPGPWDSMMMLIVDAGTEDPPVLPIHRVAEQGVWADGSTGRRVRDMTEVLASLRDDDLTYGVARIEGGQMVHRVASLSGAPPTVRALHAEVLDHIPELHLRFTHDAVAAERAVIEGRASAAFFLPATNVERVWTLVQRGEDMPQKSTYFWPKPRTGLVIRPFFHS